MTYYDAYIGDLGDPSFQETHGNWNGNAPRRLGPLFPLIRHDSFDRSTEWAKNEGCVFQQADWGCQVTKVDKAQLMRFMDFYYGPAPPTTDNGSMTKGRSKGKASHVRAFIQTLDDNKCYGLVFLES